MLCIIHTCFLDSDACQNGIEHILHRVGDFQFEFSFTNSRRQYVCMYVWYGGVDSGVHNGIERSRERGGED